MAEWNEANLESSSNSYHAIIIQTFGLTQIGYDSLFSTNICASSFATLFHAFFLFYLSINNHSYK